MSEQDSAELLSKELGYKPPEEEAPKLMPSNEECAAKLREEYVIYLEQMYGEEVDAGFQDVGFFFPGSLVTPRREGYVKDHGTPYLVLESTYEARPNFASDWCGTMRDGMIPNLRVGRWTPFGMVVAWVEAWSFEDYEPSN